MKILRIQHMLRADPTAGGRAQIRLEDHQNGFEHRHAGQAERGAAFIHLTGKLLVHHRIKHDAGFALHLIKHTSELLLISNQRVDVLDRPRVLVLRGCGASCGQESLAGRIRNHVKMEEALRLLHGFLPRHVDAC